jgi:hypothetical protein
MSVRHYVTKQDLQLIRRFFVVPLAVRSAVSVSIEGSMAAISKGRRRGNAPALKHLMIISASALVMASCSSPTTYQAAAIQASESGDQKAAASLAAKDVEQFSASGQCAGDSTLNCGTLALAYGSLAQYQILGGDKAAGERSFLKAKGAIARMDRADRPSAVGMVYHDVSEGYWKVGDKTRAREVFNEGRDAGADKFLYFASAARLDVPEPTDAPQPSPPTD